LFVLIRQAGWPFRLRAGGFLVVFYLAGLLSILRTGITSSGALYLAAVPPLTMLLFGSNFGLATILVSASAWLGAGILFSAAGIRIPEPVSGDIFVWLYAGVDLLLIIVVFVQFFRQFRQTQEFAVKVAQQERDLQIAGQRYTQQLAAVAEVGRAVTTRLELQDLLGILVELLQETFGYYGVNVWLLSEPPDLVQLKAGYNPQGEDLSKMDIQVSMEEEDHITWVCKTGQPKLTADLESQPTIGLDSALALDDFPSARSQLLLPLQLTHKRLGALEILSDRPDIFGDEDVVLMQSLADQLTIAIRNATLYEGERQRRHLAETLYQVGRALSSTLDLDDVLDLILEQLDQIVPADRLAVLILEEDHLDFMAVHGFPGEIQAADLRILMRDDGIFGRILSTQETLTIPDVLGNSDWQAIEGLPQARSWMGVPLILSGEVVGMLSLTRESVFPYTPSEATSAQTFAGQAVLALENARLYDNLARFNQRLEEMVQERTEELQLAYEQLEQLDRTKTDFIKITSHELRTPLTILQGYSQMLMDEAAEKSNIMFEKLASEIHNGAERMHTIVNGMLDIAKIDSRSLELSTEPVGLSFLLKGVVQTYEPDLKKRELIMTVSGVGDLPPIEADAKALYKVFSHLVGNAIKYTPDGGEITVSGRLLEPQAGDYPEGWVEIVVNDTGIGIAPEFQELIFTKFFQTGEIDLHSSGRTKFKGGGPGLGLPIARGIIQAHQGRLWVESPGHDDETCPGSHFHIVLPVRQHIIVDAGV